MDERYSIEHGKDAADTLSAPSIGSEGVDDTDAQGVAASDRHRTLTTAAMRRLSWRRRQARPWTRKHGRQVVSA
jgi:hypothetical protein